LCSNMNFETLKKTENTFSLCWSKIHFKKILFS
jgi:hypothetical protein